ncbi:neuralized pats1, partial [Mytilus galloprovincialis]
GDVEEQRTSLENSIEELFQNHGGKKHLQYKPLIFVNARNKEDEELATLKKQLVDVALDHPRCGELMPTKFVPLELQLARKVEENKKILTMDELNDINKQNDKIALTSDQLKSFLKVNHALGKLIYFDEAGLRDNVIIDPVFLVDVLRSIVTDDQFWPEHLKEILKSLKESGKLLKRDLYEIWKQDCFREIWAHNDYIVDMLVHLDIMCRPKDDEDGSDFFLVPCMISTKREDSQQIDHDRSIHLAYRFKEEVVPPAVLYRFIATFISIWKLRVSSKSSRLMIFTDSADIGIPCGTDLCFFDHTLSSKKEWKCPDHNIKHNTNIVSIWFADKLPTEDDRCPRDCSGLDKVWLDRQPEDKHLGRLASKLTHEDTRTIYMLLKQKEPALQWDIINESNKREGFNIKLNALYDWKKSSKYVSFKQLQKSANATGEHDYQNSMSSCGLEFGTSFLQGNALTD